MFSKIQKRSVLLVAVQFAFLLLSTEARLGSVSEQRELQSIEVVPNHNGNLGMCQGDCDRDSDCIQGYKCYHRPAGTAVPMCDGGENHMAKTDFCVPQDVPDNLVPTIQMAGHAGTDGVPSKLGLCQGDCDNNNHCSGNLVCHQRERNEPIPGCTGVDPSKTDYCINPASLSGGPSYDVTTRVTYRYQIRGQDRQPTQAEYNGLKDATDEWMTDGIDDVFGIPQNQLLGVDLVITNNSYQPGANYPHEVDYRVTCTFASGTSNRIGEAQLAAALTDSVGVLQITGGQPLDTLKYMSTYLPNASPDTNIFRNTAQVSYSSR